MTFFTKAADLVQRTATLALFGTFVACGVGIVNQVREYKQSAREGPVQTENKPLNLGTSEGENLNTQGR